MDARTVRTLSAAELRRDYLALRADGASRAARREAYNAYFRAACAEGHPPDQLALYSRDEVERFYARTVPGPEGHVFWIGGQDFVPNSRLSTRPVRWIWRHARGPLGPRDFVEPVCGEARCVNVDHLAIVPRAERRYRFPDHAAIGALQVLALRLGRTPRGDEWDEAGLAITSAAVSRRFGTWNRFVAAAGLTPNRPNRTIEDSTCAVAVAALTRRLGYQPSEFDWKRNREWLRARGYPTSPDTRGVAKRLRRGRRASA